MRKLLLLAVASVLCLQGYSQSVPTFETQVLHKLPKSEQERLAKLKNVQVNPFLVLKDESFTPHDYNRGFFIVNEDWYGHRNSTINHFSDNFEVEYETVKKNNPGKSLGCTNQYAMIWGDKVFCVSKQDQDPGENTVVGARFTVLDKNTMKIQAQFKEFPNKADGRGCLGVSLDKVYVGTSSGIVIYDINKKEFTDTIPGTAASKKGDLYHGQIGSMVQIYGKVFAVHQQKGLLVIDPKADTIITTIKPLFTTKGKNGNDANIGFGSVVASKDGRLWLSVCDASGSGNAYKVLECVEPKTLNHTSITIPDEFYGPANSWYAWTPDGFCASVQNNVLYWNGGKNSWFSNKMIFKYDLDENKFSKFIDLGDSSPWKMYGCSFRVNPLNDESVMSQFREFGIKDYQVLVYDKDGNESKKITLDPQYWFPSLPMFPDQSDPSVRISFYGGEMFNDEGVLQTKIGVNELPLKDIAYDFDNMECLMSKEVISTSDNLKGSFVKNDTLYVNASSTGMGRVTLRIMSNGQFFDENIEVNVLNTTGIEITSQELKIVGIYTLEGKKVNEFQKGINIVKYSDGSVRKVLK